MSFSNSIKNSFKDYYNLKRLYYNNLYKNNCKHADSDNLFLSDLKHFDKVERWHTHCLLQHELDNPPQEIRNSIIILVNCFGRKFMERWIATYLEKDKDMSALNELEMEYQNELNKRNPHFRKNHRKTTTTGGRCPSERDGWGGDCR